MPKQNPNSDKDVKLKTFIIKPEFEQDLSFLRDFYTTDAQIIREAVHLLRLVREGVVQVTRTNTTS
jgi:hypothetical protein